MESLTMRDLFLALISFGVLAVGTIIWYAVDELHERKHNSGDDLDRELRELIGEDK